MDLVEIQECVVTHQLTLPRQLSRDMKIAFTHRGMYKDVVREGYESDRGVLLCLILIHDQIIMNMARQAQSYHLLETIEETFFRARKIYKPPPDMPARNKVLLLLWFVCRRVMANARRTPLSAEFEPLFDLPYEDQVDDFKIDVLQMLDCLTKRQRVVITELYFNGLDITSLARKNDVSHQAVRQIHHLALQRLRREAAKQAFRAYQVSD